MSLYCVIIAFHLGILFSAFDIRPDRVERILDMLKQRDKDEPRWRSQWVLNMPIALFSWSVISFLVGLALLVVEPLGKVGWEKDGWVCFLSFLFFLTRLSCSALFGHGSCLFDFILSFKDWATDVGTDRHRLLGLFPSFDQLLLRRWRDNPWSITTGSRSSERCNLALTSYTKYEYSMEPP